LKFSVVYLVLFVLFCSHHIQAQCFEIESILVDACGPQEGLNEMVRFKVGSAPLNTSNLIVNWPNNAWQGLIQNAFTASQTAALNTQVINAGGCAQLLEPTDGVLPANSTVILITSFNVNTVQNPFGAISEDIYVLYQNNPSNGNGHFANFGVGIRTLTMSFGSCFDLVSYDRALLIDQNGEIGPGDGATVLYDPAGNPTYVNFGCFAPVPPFLVNIEEDEVIGCAGTIVTLSATAEGQQSLLWSAAVGTFSDPTQPNLTFTIPEDAVDPIVLTLTATDACGNTTSDTIQINLTGPFIPDFEPSLLLCSGDEIPELNTTSPNGISGTWSPDTITPGVPGDYTFTPNPGQCAVPVTITTAFTLVVTPIFEALAPVCSGTPLTEFPTLSNNGINGSWSPALDNTTTTTYTFTPTEGQCAEAVTLTLEIIPLVTPVFDSVAPVCSGTMLAELPNLSNNGITGSWSPALNNTVTTTYTFTPDEGLCATVVTLTIEITDPVTPVFETIQPVCMGISSNPLPVVSVNGISGIWSPAFNNAETTTYTFNPAEGQCAEPVIITVEVIPMVTPDFDAVGPVCFGTPIAELPTLSNNGISGTWTPTLNTTATTTYTFTPNPNQCATNVTLTLEVIPLVAPTFDAVAPVCSGALLAELPTLSNNGITGSWSPALDNTTTTTYTFTPATGQCASETSLTIVVNDLPQFFITEGCVGLQYTLAAEVTSPGGTVEYSWLNSSGVEIGTGDSVVVTAAGTYRLIVTENGCSDELEVFISSALCEIQRGISPNNDQLNDSFDLSNFNVRELQIFNRYGTQVFSRANYSNEWTGQSSNGKELPDGTYFYVIHFQDQESKTGWIYINRAY